jgi:hypothetical protein
VLLDLARHGHVKLTLAPGSLNVLPSDIRNDFTLMIEDATIAQALEVISGTTGLEFSVTDEGIDARPALGLRMGETVPSAGESSRGRAGVILRTSFIGSDGLERDVLVPLFDLPDDLVQQIEQQRAHAIFEMRKHWVAPAVDRNDAAVADDNDDLVPPSLKPDIDAIRKAAGETQPKAETPPSP